MKTFLILYIVLQSAFAHEGPPYPILVNKQINEASISVWADPDVGEGSFQVYVEGQARDYHFRLEAVPPDKIGSYLQQSTTMDAQGIRTAVLPFHTEGIWEVTLVVLHNDIEQGRVTMEVDVTPPGPSRWEFVLYLIPFIVLAGFWLKAIYMRKNR